MRSILELPRVASFLLLALAGCAAAPDGITEPIPIDVPHLFHRVRRGDELVGKRLILSGVALTTSSSGMVMVGDPVWLDRDGDTEFVVVFGIPSPVARGTAVRYPVLVSAAQKSGPRNVTVEVDVEDSPY